VQAVGPAGELVPRGYSATMTTPDFVLALREKIGTAPLWLSGVTAVVVRGADVLLVRRSDNGEWTPVTGIIDPGEEPAIAAVREVEEEAAVIATAQRLVWVRVTEPTIYPNGDQSQYLDLVFRLDWVSGEPHPADGENTEAGWFALADLPPMSDDMRARVQAAVDNEPEARFHVSAQ
jgi:8-oxo-dGTP pyrophosphatase MutT (NUDIX family)